MKGLNRRLFLGTLLLGQFLTSSLAQPPTGSAAFGSWKRVALKEQGLPFFSGLLEMRIATGNGKNLVFTTQATARFMGARIAMSETRTTLDPVTGRPRLYTDRSKKSARRYIFGAHGYTIEKLEPIHGPDRPLAEWRVYFEKEFAYPDDGSGGQHPVYDYYGMLLHLRESALEKRGDEITVYVATSDGPTPYRVRVAEAGAANWAYRVPTLKARRTVPVQTLRLRVAPADPGRANEGFLQMEGETELWVEATSKTLLSLGGKVPNVPGRVRLVLVEME